ncbi:MAG: hypothetical protein JWQ28_2507 [Pedobacter sp.]|jgi:hypothetical protein|nr:hypothetical protein [Pedobacter sp.]
MNNYLGVLLILTLTSCTNSKKHVVSAQQNNSAARAIEGVQLESPKIQAIYESYIALKNSLVASKYDDSKIAANQLSLDLGEYQGCETTALIAKKISVSKDLQEQRKEFTYLSSDVIALFMHTTIKQGVIYVAHCPMANHGEGGDWLSGEKKIQNPYYGDAMLECGAVTQVLKKN